MPRREMTPEEEEALDAALERALGHDALRARIGHLVARQCTHGAQATVALLDVDDLGHVTATCGQAAADAALETLLAALRSRLRQGDELIHLGSDEYCVLMPDTRLPAGVDVLYGLVMELHRAQVAPGAVAPVLTYSAGCAGLEQPSDHPELLLRFAHRQLRLAKVEKWNVCA